MQCFVGDWIHRAHHSVFELDFQSFDAWPEFYAEIAREHCADFIIFELTTAASAKAHRGVAMRADAVWQT